jgi:hypothetical protein
MFVVLDVQLINRRLCRDVHVAVVMKKKAFAVC